MVARSSLIFSSIALLTSFVNAYGQVAQVVDANNFCVFLPPSDSADRIISDTEWNAEAFCIGKTPLAKNAGKLSSGFIQSAHFVKTDTYVQVTGQINPSKARLDPKDEGGQMDIKAPKGSSCAGWKYYVNLIEPAGNTYCMRCCNDDRTCNRGISEKGCAHIIPGDYSGPYGGDKGSSEPPAATDSKSSTKAKTTTTKTKTKTTGSDASKTAAPKTTDPVADSGSASTSTPGADKPVADSGSANTSTPGADKPVADSGSANTSTPGADKPVADSDSATASSTPGVDAPVVGADPATGSSTAASSEATTTPAETPVAATSPAPAASSNVEILNQKVTEQSVSGAEAFNPGMITLAITAVSMALMLNQ